VEPVYISITGLKLKSVLSAPKFWLHAIPSMVQAQSAQGNLKAEAQTINHVHHTLTVWISDEAMRAYLYSGAHAKAIKAFGSIATGKTFGYWSTHIPSWNEVHSLWLLQGKDYV
jgi:hypothetical protein